MKRPALAGVAAVLLATASGAHAHGFAPSLLTIDQTDDQTAVVRFFPARALAGAAPRIVGCTTTTLPDGVRATCPSGRLELLLPDGSGDVLVQHQRPSGVVAAAPAALGERLTIALGTPASPSLWASVALGARHIGSGVDHLMFVAALVALVGFRRRLLWLISGFTLGHSITLALGSLQLVVVPPLFVEALIALSLVMVARELVRPSPASLLQRRPLLLAAGFGLVHGCGFAAALTALGVDRAARLSVLLGFNLGVELGQLAFVAVLLVAAAGLRRLRRLAPAGRPAIAYAVGTAGVALLCERVAQW